MTIHEYLVKAVQDDARRAGERDRLLLEARRARRARRQHLFPAAPVRRRTETGKIVVSENVTLDGVIQDPAGDEGFRAGGWADLTGNSPQLAPRGARARIADSVRVWLSSARMADPRNPGSPGRSASALLSCLPQAASAPPPARSAAPLRTHTSRIPGMDSPRSKSPADRPPA